MNNQDFGKFISTLRKEKSLTQIELAEKINVSDKAISRWENGKNYPDIEVLEALAKELGVSISELIACKKFEAPIEAEYETAKAYIDESNKVRKLKKIISVIIVFILMLAIILVVPTSFASVNGESDNGTSEMQALTYKVVKWKKIIGNSTYNHTSWYFMEDSKKSLEQLWKNHIFEFYYNDQPYIEDIRSGSLNIGAEMPYILYMDYQIVVFYGTCGLVVYNYENDRIENRLSMDMINALGYDIVYPIMDTEDRIIYFEQNPYAESDVLPLSYSMDSRILSRINEIPRFAEDNRITFLDEKTRIKYEIKNNYLTSGNCFNNIEMKAFLIADNDWNMASLKLIIEQNNKTTEYKIFK